MQQHKHRWGPTRTFTQTQDCSWCGWADADDEIMAVQPWVGIIKCSSRRSSSSRSSSSGCSSSQGGGKNSFLYLAEQLSPRRPPPTPQPRLRHPGCSETLPSSEGWERSCTPRSYHVSAADQNKQAQATRKVQKQGRTFRSVHPRASPVSSWGMWEVGGANDRSTLLSHFSGGGHKKTEEEEEEDNSEGKVLIWQDTRYHTCACPRCKSGLRLALFY